MYLSTSGFRIATESVSRCFLFCFFSRGVNDLPTNPQLHDQCSPTAKRIPMESYPLLSPPFSLTNSFIEGSNSRTVSTYNRTENLSGKPTLVQQSRERPTLDPRNGPPSAPTGWFSLGVRIPSQILLPREGDAYHSIRVQDINVVNPRFLNLSTSTLVFLTACSKENGQLCR